MPMDALIIDLDGTLFDDRIRLEKATDEHGNIDYVKLRENMELDGIWLWCEELVCALGLARHVFFVTGRSDICKQETMAFVDREFPFLRFSLFMRKEGDYRDCVEVKKEIYDKHIKEDFNVILAIDDNAEICKMWASLGIPTLQHHVAKEVNDEC